MKCLLRGWQRLKEGGAGYACPQGDSGCEVVAGLSTGGIPRRWLIAGLDQDRFWSMGATLQASALTAWGPTRRAHGGCNDRLANLLPVGVLEYIDGDVDGVRVQRWWKGFVGLHRPREGKCSKDPTLGGVLCVRIHDLFGGILI